MNEMIQKIEKFSCFKTNDLLKIAAAIATAHYLDFDLYFSSAQNSNTKTQIGI